MKIVTSADSLNAVEAMVRMLEEREWAEHVGVCDVTRRLETAITGMHNEIAQKNVECDNYERDNAQAVEFLSGQRDGLGELCNAYRDEIWRLRDGINALLNICTPENNDHILRELRDLATSKIEVCPPLKDQKVVGQRYASAFDALIDDLAEREDLKKRSRAMRILRNTISDCYQKKTYQWLAQNVGFSQPIWQAIFEGHIDELEYDVLERIAAELCIDISEEGEGLAATAIVLPTDVNELMKITHAYAVAIVKAARALNTTKVSERYMIPMYCEVFKITKQEWLILEMMFVNIYMPDALPMMRLIQIAKDGDVTLPVVDLE